MREEVLIEDYGAGKKIRENWKTVALVFLLLFAGIGSIRALVSARAQDSRSAQLVAYLRSLRNDTIGLMSETESGDQQGKKSYWINDNIFVYQALKVRGDQPDKEVAEKIRLRLVDLTKELNLPTHPDGFPKLGLHDVVAGYEFSLPLRCPNTYILDRGAYKLAVTIWNGSRTPQCFVQDFKGYADNILYHALSAFNGRNLTYARMLFQDALPLWDGTGFADDSFINPNDPQYGRYATYKLALFLYVADLLSVTVPFRNQIVTTIWKMETYEGGIITNYGKQLTPIGGANAETTALALLANPMETSISSPTQLPVNLIVPVLLVVILAVNIITLVIVASRLQKGKLRREK